MGIEQLTYADLGERLDISAEAARSLVRRMHLPRQKANGKRSKTRGIGMIIRFPRPRESDSLRACRRPTILTACRTSN